MYNIIIVDDNKFFLDQIKNFITSYKNIFKYDINIHMFNEYDENFYKLKNLPIDNKIYILDIETKNGNGLDEAEDIYEINSKSKVIIISSYENKYYSRMLRFPDFYIGFISKKQGIDNIEDDIYKYISKAIKLYNINDSFIVKNNNYTNKIYIDEVTFIESNNRHTIIHRLNKSNIESKIPLKIFEKKLPKNFKKTHKSCIVNFHNIDSLNAKDNMMTFKDGTNTDLISRKYKKDTINCLEKISLNILSKTKNKILVTE